MTRKRMILCGAALLAMMGPVLADTAALGSSSGIIALNSLPDPPATLATANVTDAKGMVVGAVQKVVMDASGKPASVDVALLGSGAVVAVDAAKFNYDQGHNILMAALDAEQIAQQPRAPQG
jgi:hypothetical protein